MTKIKEAPMTYQLKHIGTAEAAALLDFNQQVITKFCRENTMPDGIVFSTANQESYKYRIDLASIVAVFGAKGAVSSASASARFGVSAATVRRWRKTGKIVGVNFGPEGRGAEWRFGVESIENHLGIG